MPPSVYVLMLNYNGGEHLEYSLPSVLETEYSHCQVVLIDNGSSDGSVAFTREHHPQVKIIENRRNLGWAAGNNVGIRYALEQGADYVVLLNNDMRVDPRWLTYAVAVAEADPLIAFVGFDTVGEYHVLADPDRAQFRERQLAWQRLTVAKTEHIAGCALFVRTSVFQDIGFIDERFFAYGEEDDLQKRARRAGYRSVRINIPLWHYNGGYWGQASLLKAAALAQRNHVRVMLKNDTPRMALRRLLGMAQFVCSPGIEYDRTHAHQRRLRPSVYPVNVAILLYAVLWNLAILPATLLARYHDEQRIQVARQRLMALQASSRGNMR